MGWCFLFNTYYRQVCENDNSNVLYVLLKLIEMCKKSYYQGKPIYKNDDPYMKSITPCVNINEIKKTATKSTIQT